MFRNVCDDEYFNESRVAGPVNAIVLIIADTVIQCWYFAIHVNSPAHFSILIRCNEYISVNEFSSFMGMLYFRTCNISAKSSRSFATRRYSLLFYDKL